MSSSKLNVSKQPSKVQWLSALSLNAKLFLAAFGGGLMLSATTFAGLSAALSPVQLLSFFAFVPLFVLLLRHRQALQRWPLYWMGCVFFAAWYLPTTYWYFDFMPLWLAPLASVGFTLLMANFWSLFRLRKLPNALLLLLFTLLWFAWTFARLRLPILENWWLPGLGYAVWRLPAATFFAKFGGFAGVEVFILLVNAALALGFVKWRWKASFLALAALLLFVGANETLTQFPQQSFNNIIALQSSQNLAMLENQTRAALQQKPTDAVPIVVWPENHLSPAELTQARNFAREQGLNLILDSTDARNYNVEVLLNPRGQMVLTNSKYHIAPGETHQAQYSRNFTQLRREKVTILVCYDLHFPDAVARMTDAQTVFASVNDQGFGSLERNFHLADVAFDAVQSGSNVVLSSTDGPTAFVDHYGRVTQELPFGKAGLLRQ